MNEKRPVGRMDIGFQVMHTLVATLDIRKHRRTNLQPLFYAFE